MENKFALRQKLLTAFCAPIKRLDGLTLDMLFQKVGDLYRIPVEFEMPGKFGDDAETVRHQSVMTIYVNSVNELIRVTNDKFTLTDDSACAAYCDDILEAQKDPKLLCEILELIDQAIGESPHGTRFLAGLILSKKKYPSFDSAGFISKIVFLSLLGSKN